MATATRKKRYKTVELDVVVRTAGPHEDLSTLPGTLFLDHDRKGRVYEATFDPANERVPNAILQVVGMLRGDDRIVLRDDEGVSWHFDIAEDEDDGLDYEHDADHPLHQSR